MMSPDNNETTNFIETILSGQLEISRTDLPWLPNKLEKASLVKIKAQNGVEFYLGSLVRGKRLVEAAQQMDRQRSDTTTNILYNLLPEFLERNTHSRVKSIIHGVAEKSIYYAGNPSGQRVYFMRLGDREGLPVVVKVAACDKARQMDVLATLTNQNTRNIKKQSKL